MGYRDTYFKNNPPVNGKYQCRCCGRWFPKSQIDVDHIIPQNRGGTDELWNLQAMCKTCNRSKQDTLDTTGVDLATSIVKNVVQGNSIDNVGGTIASVVGKNAMNQLEVALGFKKPRKTTRKKK